ncbi:MAG TPA: helix-turn-helix domain-containing protein, partial [Candidatus Gracilibacteria bacterium]
MTKKTSTEIRQILSQLGLNEKESILYLAALELGECSIKELSEKTNINRTTIYLYINPLKQKGFLSEIKKGNRTTFIAEDPRDITNIVDRQKNELKTQIGELDLVSEKLPEVMQGLLAISSSSHKDKPHVRFFEGIEGIKQVHYHILNHAQSVDSFFSIKNTQQPEIQEFLTKEYIEGKV